MKYPKFIGSSANEENLSLTIKGALIYIVPILVAIFTGIGVDVTPETIIELINTIFATIASITTIIGIGRKFYFAFKNRKQ